MKPIRPGWQHARRIPRDPKRGTFDWLRQLARSRDVSLDRDGRCFTLNRIAVEDGTIRVAESLREAREELYDMCPELESALYPQRKMPTQAPRPSQQLLDMLARDLDFTIERKSHYYIVRDNQNGATEHVPNGNAVREAMSRLHRIRCERR